MLHLQVNKPLNKWQGFHSLSCSAKGNELSFNAHEVMNDLRLAPHVAPHDLALKLTPALCGIHLNLLAHKHKGCICALFIQACTPFFPKAVFPLLHGFLYMEWDLLQMPCSLCAIR